MLLATAACADGGNAGTMNRATEDQPCRVVDAGKLPAEVGGADGLCSAIARAIEARAPGLEYAVEVRVISASRLSATLVTGDGRRLPEKNFAIMDRNLNAASIQRFAEAIAGQLVEAGSR